MKIFSKKEEENLFESNACLRGEMKIYCYGFSGENEQQLMSLCG